MPYVRILSKNDGGYELTEAERKEKKRLRQAYGNAYINLQLTYEELPYDLVSLAKTEELPDGCTRDAWERLTSEYDLTEGEDKITLITMDEIKKRLKERYLQLKRDHGWSEDEMSFNMKSSDNQNKNIKKGSKGKYFKGRCNHCGKFGHKKADCWDLKNKKEKHQENEKKVLKDKSKVRCFKCGKLGRYASEQE